MKLSRKADGETFRGAVVGLGALGVITRITLDIQPTYTVRQYVYEDLPLDQMKDHFDEIQASGYSVSLFTDWQKKRINEVWIKTPCRMRDSRSRPRMFFGAKLATRNLHPIAELSAENCTEQMGVRRPLVRPAAPLPDGLHSQRRKRIAVGILCAARTPSMRFSLSSGCATRSALTC